MTVFDKDYRDVSWEMTGDDAADTNKKAKPTRSTAILKTKTRGQETVIGSTGDLKLNLKILNVFISLFYFFIGSGGFS